jgi:acetate kinase
MPNDSLLVLNAGSSSIKFRVFRVAAGRPELTIRGIVDAIGMAPSFAASDVAGTKLGEHRWPDGAALRHEAFLDFLLGWLDDRLGGDKLIGAAHRVVHGGTDYAAPVRIDRRVIADLVALVPLAPLHQPHNLAAIEAVARRRPALLQVACFDTAFHRSLPEVAARFALPRELTDSGLRRYGFHGLSYQYIAHRLAEDEPALAGGRVVVAHLGAGASMCAMRGGSSVATTMGFTALDGLMMATRAGAIDPGIILHLLQQRGMEAAEIERLLYHRSGLLGVSGLSADMRTLLASDDPRAAEAVELFVYRIVRELGSLAAALGGLDGLVFTAGIGENAPAIRARVCAASSWLGIALDADANEAGKGCISAAGSPVAVRAIPTDEELMIARHALALLPDSKE